jgi:large subunit ribosomal protein L9
MISRASRIGKILAVVCAYTAVNAATFEAASSGQRATFVPPAVPTALRTDRSIITSYGLQKEKKSCPATRERNKIKHAKPSMAGPALLAKRGGKAGAATKGGKIQVKLLKYVEGTGTVGDVVMVAPAFFENKLKRSNSAVLITDDEVTEQNAEEAASNKEKRAAALDMKQKIEVLELSITRKAGPEGHLFGGVGKKDILQELKDHFPKGALEGKQIKVVSVNEEEGKEVKGDIKVVGMFKSNIALLKDIKAEFIIEVKGE